MNGNVRGRELYKKYSRFLEWLIRFYSIFPVKIREWILERRRNKTGLVQIGLRYALLCSIAKDVGDNVRINENVYLRHVQNLSIGSNVSIWPMTYIEASGGIRIGNDVSIAHSVTIMSEEHAYGDLHIPIKDQGKIYEPVTIEDNVWIGAKATILSGVTIGEGAIVGAGAVVTRDVPRYTIVAGVPARVKKQR